MALFHFLCFGIVNRSDRLAGHYFFQVDVTELLFLLIPVHQQPSPGPPPPMAYGRLLLPCMLPQEEGMEKL